MDDQDGSAQEPMSNSIATVSLQLAVEVEAAPGEYECRWYCEQGRFTVELTRGRFDVPPLTTNVSDSRQPDVDV